MGTRTAPRAKAKAKRKALRQRAFRTGARQTTAQPTGDVRNQPGGSQAPIALAQEICRVPGSSAPYLHPASCSLPAAECGESTAERSSLKQVAAAALILGQNVTKTAEALGVDRRTLQRWGTYDPDFHTALAETKQEVVVVTRQSMLAVLESAVEIVETKLAVEKSPRVALAFLRGIGVVSPEPLASLAKPSSENKNRSQTATLAAEAAHDSPPSAATQAVSPEADSMDEVPVYELADLPPEQQRALAELYAGRGVAEVAVAVSASEATIRGWICHDVRFFTLLSGFQFDRIVHLKHRLIKLINSAVEIVRQGVASGDGRLALALLRGMGLLR